MACFNFIFSKVQYTTTVVNMLKTFLSAYATLGLPMPEDNKTLKEKKVEIGKDEFEQIHELMVCFCLCVGLF